MAQRQADFLSTPVPAGELELVEAVPAEYPEVAVRNNIEGWVEVQFVVGRDGRPTGLEVVAAEPPGRFDQAALEAVSAYRYAPFELDGTVYERLARLRIRFALQ